MKDDLISRKAAIKIAEKYSISKGTTIGKHSGIAEIIADKLAELPSVPAVPLEPLCNFLAAYAAPPVRSPLAIYGSIEEAWKAFLIEWMEEQQS